MAATGFDASKYLTNLRGKEYLEVKWRLLWLRTQHPDATIETEMVEHDAGLALFRARVSVPDGGSATGWGSETVDDFGDFIEKAETKALGRALAALGFGTQFCEDYNFGIADAALPRGTHARRASEHDSKSTDANSSSADAAHARRGGADAPLAGDTHVVDAPVAKGRLKAVRDGGAASGTAKDSATSSQINAITAIAREHHALGETGVEERCRATYGCLPGELSKQQASEFIVQLRRHGARPGERPGAQMDAKQASRRQRQPA